MSRRVSQNLEISKVQNLRFSYSLINPVKYFRVLNLYKLFYYGANERERDLSIKSKVLLNFLIRTLFTLDE